MIFYAIFKSKTSMQIWVRLACAKFIMMIETFKIKRETSSYHNSALRVLEKCLCEAVI